MSRIDTTKKNAEAASRSALSENERRNPGIAEHLEFLSSLAKKFSWVQDKREAEELERLIENARKRLENPNLYVAVIGEFTSGKSSLINAWVDADLLVTDILPATTASATCIRAGAEPALRVDWIDEKQQPHTSSPGSIEELSLELSRVTTDEATAAAVECVHAELPTPELGKQIVIIDTPGTDVDNPRHAKVAAWAAEDISDLLLITLPANAPLGQRFESFLKDHVAEALHRALFVVTKIDLIPQKQRSRLMEQTISRVGVRFDLASPWVTAVSPLAARSDQWPAGRQEELSHLQSEFSRFRAKLGEWVEQRRQATLLERTLELTEKASQYLRTGLESHAEKVEQEHRAFEANPLRDLKKFVDEGKERAAAQFLPTSAELVEKTVDRFDGYRRRMSRSAKKAIDQASDAGRIYAELETALEKAQRRIGNDFRRSSSDMLEKMQEQAQKALRGFEDDFQSSYDGLEALGAKALSQKTLESKAKGLAQDLGDRLEEISDSLAGRSLYLPSLGEEIADLLDGLIGGGFGDDLRGLFGLETLADKKRKLKSLVAQDLKGELDSVEDEVARILNRERKLLKKKLSKQIHLYQTNYQEVVQDMIEADRKKIAELKKRKSQISGALRELDRRVAALKKT